MSMTPIFLYNMRVERTYTGGKLLDKWQGVTPASDGWEPEEWIASTIRSRFAEDPDSGLSRIKNKELDGQKLIDFINSDPERILGRDHYRKYGQNLGFLAKIIDSDERLNIQAHPNREQAKRFFGSDFGKTEAWYIMDTRIIHDEEPYILLGFKPGMTKEKWVNLIETQDKDAMVESLHKIPVKPGDVFLIESGMPHAIGSGCMLAEIQEPTDFTFRVEKINAPGKKFPERTYHQGIGYDNMYSCFDYTTYEYEEILKKAKLPAIPREQDSRYTLLPLIRTENTAFFSMEKISVHDRWEGNNAETFSIAFVLNGSGQISHKEEAYSLYKGDELFLPCSSEPYELTNDNIEISLEILFCYPPGILTK